MNQQLVSPETEQWIGKQKPDHSPPKLSVIVPSFNEQWRLPPTLIDMIDFFDSRGQTYEIIVVDDGSNDATSTVVAKFAKIRDQVRQIRLAKNRGKGHAVKTGVLNAEGEIILFADADGATPIEEFERLLNALSNDVEIAIGSRALGSSDTKVTTRWYRKYLGRIFNFVVNVVTVPGIADTQCGFKLFTAKAAKFLFERQQSEGYSFDVEVLFLAQKAGIKVAEVPINWSNVPGSKVNLLFDSMCMLWDTLRIRWRHRAVSPSDYSR